MNVEPGTSNVGGYGRHMAAIGLFSAQYKREENCHGRIFVECKQKPIRRVRGGDQGIYLRSLDGIHRHPDSSRLLRPGLADRRIGLVGKRNCETTFVQLME